MKNKEIVKRLKDSLDYEFDLSFNDRKELLSYIEQLQTTAKDCKQKLDQYENPDDLTLFYMWLDEKAKDKMKQLENNRDKAIEILTYKQNAFNTCFSVCDVIDILKGDSDD